jgi:hypothetical protein
VGGAGGQRAGDEEGQERRDGVRSSPMPYGAYPQLGPIAESLGLPDRGAPGIELVKNGISVHISLRIDSGTIRGIDVHATCGPLPVVTLRREDEADRAGKARGINVEAQVGDPEFDHAVYVDTQLDSERVRVLFASKEAQRAVLQLVHTASTVELSPAGVVVRLDDNPGTFQPAAFRPLLDAILTVAALTRANVPLGRSDERRGAWLVVLSFAALPFSVGAAILAHVLWAPDTAALSGIGAGAGLVLWLLLRPLFVRAVRGHSRGLRFYRQIAITQFFALSLFGCGIAVGANGGCDRSSLERKGVIETTEHVRGDGHDITRTTVRWDATTRTELDFEDDDAKLRPGDAVVEWFHKGAFGFAWGRDAVATSTVAVYRP